MWRKRVTWWEKERSMLSMKASRIFEEAERGRTS